MNHPMSYATVLSAGIALRLGTISWQTYDVTLGVVHSSFDHFSRKYCFNFITCGKIDNLLNVISNY